MGKKYACDLLQKEKEVFKISSFSYTLLMINYGHIYKAIEKARDYNKAPTKSVIKPQNQWIYAKNACCV